MALGDAAKREAKRRTRGGRTLGSYSDEDLESYKAKRTPTSEATFIPGKKTGRPGVMEFSNEDLSDEAFEDREKWRDEFVRGAQKYPRAHNRRRRFSARQAGDALAKD